jgi:hypothetical protein
VDSTTYKGTSIPAVTPYRLANESYDVSVDEIDGGVVIKVYGVKAEGWTHIALDGATLDIAGRGRAKLKRDSRAQVSAQLEAAS